MTSEYNENAVNEKVAERELPSKNLNPSFNSLNADDLKKGVEGGKNTLPKDYIFKTQTANQRIKEASLRPNPNKLFGNFWQEHELSILFADNGIGKSILAVQIAQAIANGQDVFNHEYVESEELKNEVTQPKKVIFYDFELSDKQFQRRYTDYQGRLFNFSSYFKTSNIDIDKLISDSKTPQEERIFNSIEHDLKVGCRFIIVDNITAISADTVEGKAAVKIMKQLINLKRKYQASILVLAHTPKRDETRIITKNDLSGSKYLSDLADSVFSIGRSFKEPTSFRYIKQIKVRDAEETHGTSNVVVCRIDKEDNGMLRFKYLQEEEELLHLKVNTSEEEKAAKKDSAIELLKQGYSIRKVAEQLTMSKSEIGRIAKELKQRRNINDEK